jgi:hypothetical protein
VDVCDLSRLTRPQLLAEIQRLYARLQGLPIGERPDSNRCGSGSPTYRALQAQIRAYAEAYKAKEDDVRVLKDLEDAELVTTQRRCG